MDKVVLKDSDWDQIFNKETITIGTTTLVISALSVEEVAELALLIGAVKEDLKVLLVEASDDLVVGSLNEGAKLNFSMIDVIMKALPGLALVIQSKAPIVVSKLSGLHEKEVPRLPVNVLIDILSVCLTVNIKSLESLSKNFSSLAQKMSVLSQGITQLSTQKKS